MYVWATAWVKRADLTLQKTGLHTRPFFNTDWKGILVSVKLQCYKVQSEYNLPLLGFGKLSWRRKTTLSTKCWMSHASGPRTNTIQSCVKPSLVTFFLNWALCPSSSFTCTVHCNKRNATIIHQKTKGRFLFWTWVHNNNKHCWIAIFDQRLTYRPEWDYKGLKGLTSQHYCQM